MKKLGLCFLFILTCFTGMLCAQQNGEQWMKEAEEYLSQNDYVQARSLYLKAYSSFLSQKAYQQATQCGIQVCTLYQNDHLYQEAFTTLRGVEAAILTAQQEQQKNMPKLLFAVYKERLDMYIRLKNIAAAQQQMNSLQSIAQQEGSNALKQELLFAKADLYYSFGMNSQGDQAVEQLIRPYNDAKEYSKVEACYKKLMEAAKLANNTTMLDYTSHKFRTWSDSIQSLATQEELSSLKTKYEEAKQATEQKEHTLSTKNYIIAGVCGIAGLLIIVLVLGGLVFYRFVLLNYKLKKELEKAHEHNRMKTAFIQDITAQLEPTLHTLDQQQAGVKALLNFTEHVQELSELENQLNEPLEMEEHNIATFCNKLAEQIKNKTQPDVVVQVNAPKIDVSIHPEYLERILLYLLNNAATHTPAEGRINLDLKKRGAHTYQFIVSDTGNGIPEEKRENLFKPFAEIKDLTQGDGLGLPICALLATRMKGELTLDTNYTKGARFVLELHA